MRLSLFLLFLGSINLSYAQTNVGIGTTNPNKKAILDLNSNNKTLLLPRIHDTTVVNTSNGGIAGNVAGMLAYDSTQSGLTWYDGQKWRLINDYLNNANSKASQTSSFTVVPGTGEISIPGMQIILPETGVYLAVVRYFLTPSSSTGTIAFYTLATVDGTIVDQLETYAPQLEFIAGNLSLIASGNKGQLLNIKMSVSSNRTGVGQTTSSLFSRNNVRLIRLQ